MKTYQVNTTSENFITAPLRAMRQRQDTKSLQQFFNAAARGDEAALQLMLDKGLKLDLLPQWDGTPRSTNGCLQSALVIAAENGQLAATKFLLEKICAFPEADMKTMEQASPADKDSIRDYTRMKLQGQAVWMRELSKATGRFENIKAPDTGQVVADFRQTSALLAASAEQAWARATLLSPPRQATPAVSHARILGK